LASGPPLGSITTKARITAFASLRQVLGDAVGWHEPDGKAAS
jgi:hypothetical protein